MIAWSQHNFALGIKCFLTILHIDNIANYHDQQMIQNMKIIESSLQVVFTTADVQILGSGFLPPLKLLAVVYTHQSVPPEIYPPPLFSRHSCGQAY